MLELIRKRAQGFFAWLIVGGIIITFALFGITEYLQGGGDNSVAKVNGQAISQADLDRAAFQQRQRLEQMFGGKLPEMFTEKMIKQQVLSQLVAQEVMVQAAWENGMRVSDQQLFSIIREVGAFQENGEFSLSKYEELLAAQGETKASFEARVRRDILAAQFESAYRDTSFVTRTEEDFLLRLQMQTRDIGYLTIAIAPFEKSASVADEEIQTFYDENQQRFMQPEQVKIDYVELNVDDMLKDIEINDETLRARYEAQKMNYSTPEERRASHILIQVAEDAPQEKDDAARSKAEELLARIRKGEDFAEIAKAESDDPGSAEKGGDLDFFGHGAMVPAFEEAAFALEKGQVSDLVRSPFGYHIIKLTGSRGGELKPFAEVKDKIRKEIQTERAEERFYKMAEQLKNLTFEHPESLQAASEELGLPIKTSGFFTKQGGAGIASNAKVTGAAFSEAVLERDNNSDLIELSRTHLMVLRVNEHQPEQLRPLEEVKPGIIARLKRDKASSEVEKLAASLQEQIQAGEEPSALAGDEAVSWTGSSRVSREQAEIAPAILNKAFSMPKPADGALSTDIAALRSGAQAVVVLYSVTDGDPAAVDEAERKKIYSQLLRADSNAASAAVMSGVRGRMDITTK